MRPTEAFGMMFKEIVFGSGEQGSKDEEEVEKLVEDIHNGTLEQKRSAVPRLRDLVEESPQAKLALGAIGFPILKSVLMDDRDDIELIQGVLETLVNALKIDSPQDEDSNTNPVAPGVLNSELLAREQDFVSLFLSLLEEDDFYIRFYVLQLLTALVSVSPQQLQDEVLATPQGVTRLMDMMSEREVIRNEALLMLTHLTRAAKEIQKIVVFEGAFERIFSIIKEEGGSDGGIVVQDCLELLNNLLRNNSSNQVFLRETLGLQLVVSLISLRRGTDDQQKSVNMLCALETIALLVTPEGENITKDPNVVANQTILAQANLLHNLLALGVEGRVSAAAVRCLALKCIGDLVNNHPKNREILMSKVLGDEPDAEPAVVRILDVLLLTPNLNECIAAEYVFKCFCEGNPEGQSILASTITPMPQSNKASFGSMLVQALVGTGGRNDLEASCRAASVLSHVLKDNAKCKERVLRIDLEMRTSNHSNPDYLLPRCMRYLMMAAGARNSSEGTQWLQPVLLRLLVTWLAQCPPAVAAFLETPTHLPLLVELISSSGASMSVHVAGLASVLLGECILFNDAKPSTSNSRDAGTVLEMLNQRVGLTVFFSKWEEMRQSSLFVSAAASSTRLPIPLTRSNAASVAAGDGFIASDVKDKHQQIQDSINHACDASSSEPAVTLFYDASFVQFINKLEPLVRDRIVELFSNPKSADTVEVASLEPAEDESYEEFIGRVKSLLQTQAQEIQELLARNSALAEDLLLNSSQGSRIEDSSTHKGNAALRAEVESLKHQLMEAHRRAESEKSKRVAVESEAASDKQLALKYEAELQSLSDAYNALEKVNYRLEGEVKNLRNLVESKGVSLDASEEQLEAAREEGRVEAQKESEAELNDLLVCLGQQDSNVEKLRARLEELGEDVDVLLGGDGE